MFKPFTNVPLRKLFVKYKRNSVYGVFSLGLQSNYISTSRMNYEKAVKELESNPYFNKYAQKIADLQKTSPEEFLSRLKSFEEKKKPKKSTNTSQSTPLAGQPGKPKASSSVLTKPKILADIMKTEMIENKTAEEIKHIWFEYHKNKDCIVAAVPLKNFELIQSKGERFPVFVLPLPRDQGYEFIMCQFAGNEVHFTPLISYQAYKENAPECLTIVYFPDLKETKELILMRGEFNKDILTAIEAQCLANELQLYYGEENEKRTKLLERFTYSPDDFKHMDLIANLETLSF